MIIMCLFMSSQRAPAWAQRALTWAKANFSRLLAKIPIRRTVHQWLIFINSTFNWGSTKIFNIVSNPLCMVCLIGMFPMFLNSMLNRTVRLVGSGPLTTLLELTVKNSRKDEKKWSDQGNRFKIRNYIIETNSKRPWLLITSIFCPKY